MSRLISRDSGVSDGSSARSGSIADGGSGNPNFVGWTASAGIGGDSPWRYDRGDKFGIGYVYTFRRITKGQAPWYFIALALIIIVQATVSLPLHPYYGTHYNYLIGGPKFVLNNGIVEGQEKSEGMAEAAEYLNSMPMAPLLVVGSHKLTAFYRYFEGKAVEIQIRTHEMHEHAELGVASHWRYKEGGSSDQQIATSIESLRKLLRGIWQVRRDRYSERRFAEGERPSRIEMSYIGG